MTPSHDESSKVVKVWTNRADRDKDKAGIVADGFRTACEALRVVTNVAANEDRAAVRTAAWPEIPSLQLLIRTEMANSPPTRLWVPRRR